MAKEPKLVKHTPKWDTAIKMAEELIQMLADEPEPLDLAKRLKSQIEQLEFTYR